MSFRVLLMQCAAHGLQKMWGNSISNNAAALTYAEAPSVTTCATCSGPICSIFAFSSLNSSSPDLAISEVSTDSRNTVPLGLLTKKLVMVLDLPSVQPSLIKVQPFLFHSLLYFSKSTVF